MHPSRFAPKLRLASIAVVGFSLLAGLSGSPSPRSAARAGAKASPPSESVVLFDGKTLDGWEGTEKFWSVKDGTIVGKNTEPVAVSTYLVTKRKFRDFRLTAKVKLVTSDMHSGISFWGRVAPEMGEPFTYMGHLVMFPFGWGMYDLHRRHGLPVDGKPAIAAGKDRDWNDLEILATGSRVRVGVNGKAVVDFTDPKPELIAEAPIGLQLHSNKVPQEVHFKDLILEITPKDDRLLTVK